MASVSSLQQAQDCLAKGDPMAALKALGDTDSLTQEADLQTKFFAAELYDRVNGFDEAIKLYESCLKDAPATPQIIAKLIQVHTKYGQGAKALDLFFSYPSLPEALKETRVLYFILNAIIMTGQLQRFVTLNQLLGSDINKVIENPYLWQLFHLFGATDNILPALKAKGTTVGTSLEASVIQDILQEYFNNEDKNSLLNQLHETFGTRANKTWLYYQLIRHFSYEEFDFTLTDEEPSFPIEEGAFSYLSYPKLSSVQVPLPQITESVEINSEKLKCGIENFQRLVQEMLDEGLFQTQMENLDHFLSQAPQGCDAPVFVLSSGRAGTTAIHHLFQKLPETFSYHSYQWQMNSLEMNHVLYRMLTNSFERNNELNHFKRTILNFVKMRISEIIYALHQGKRPTLTSHWDSIFTPVWSVLFPNSKFIYLHRKHEAVFKSIYEKNQWHNNQLQPLKFDATFPDGLFQACPDDRIDYTGKISWFLYVTELFAHSFFDTLIDDRAIHLESEKLFQADQQAYSDLVEFLGIPSLSNDILTEHYAAPINEKSKNPLFRFDLDIQTKKLLAYHQQLKETGRLTTI